MKLQMLLCFTFCLAGCLEASVRRHSDTRVVEKASLAEVSRNTVEPAGASAATRNAGFDKAAASGSEAMSSKAKGSDARVSDGVEPAEPAVNGEPISNRERTERALKSVWGKISSSASGVAKKIKNSFSNESEDDAVKNNAMDEVHKVAASKSTGVATGAAMAGVAADAIASDRNNRRAAGPGPARVVSEEDVLPNVDNRHWRQLLGRVERLEQQLRTLQAENNNSNGDVEKMQALQEAVLQLEQRLQKLETLDPSLQDTEKQATEEADDIKLEDVEARAPKPRTTRRVKKQKLGNFAGAQRAFSQRHWREAIQGYEKYRNLNPKGKQYALATYRMGVSFEKLGLKKEAKMFFQEIINKYPQSRWSNKVKFHLSRL